MEQLLARLPAWLWAVAILVGAVLVALLLHSLVFSVAARITRRAGAVADQLIVRHTRKPARLILPLVALALTLPGLALPARLAEASRHLIVLGLIAAAAWLVIELINVVQDLIAARYRLDISDNLEARRVRTQVNVLRRVAVLGAGIVAVSAMLMTFPGIWNIGAGLFASAGVAGLVVGMAARPTLSNLLAGVQIALTEPIRIDDVVIVEGEWGWIEEIGTTYVIVRVWDLRRLVVPLSYFIERPFQNWTRTSADLLGTVLIYMDYSVPVDEVREELQRILTSSGMWDGKSWGLQVTNATDRAMELRALMSAPNSGTAWNLRCHVREKLIGFLQARYPQALPRTRAEIRQAGDPLGVLNKPLAG